MFKVSKSTVTKKDGELEITIKTEKAHYDALYLGSKDDLLKSSIIEGTKTEDGGMTFTFTTFTDSPVTEGASCSGGSSGSGVFVESLESVEDSDLPVSSFICISLLSAFSSAT